MPLLSSFEVFPIASPSRDEAVQLALQLIEQVLHAPASAAGHAELRAHLRLGARAHEPTVMQRSVELLVAIALKGPRSRVREADCWNVMGGADWPRSH